ncbi:hypothetical protein KAR48_12615 [bacterium]|nr:hypothetical protein [bacterium]
MKKKCSKFQVSIIKKILKGQFATINDFLFQYFEVEELAEPFNKPDSKTNFIVLNDRKKMDKMICEFRCVINYLIKYKYVSIIENLEIELFTLLRKSEYLRARRGLEINHELMSLFDNHFKQKEFKINKKFRLWILLLKKGLPEKNKDMDAHVPRWVNILGVIIAFLALCWMIFHDVFLSTQKNNQNKIKVEPISSSIEILEKDSLLNGFTSIDTLCINKKLP